MLEKAAENAIPWAKIDSAVDMTNKNVQRWTEWKKSNVVTLQANSKKQLQTNQDYKDYFDVKKRKARSTTPRRRSSQPATLPHGSGAGDSGQEEGRERSAGR